MLRSYELVMAKAKKRHPSVPDKIYRWSRSHFYRYLAEVSYRGQRYAEMLCWLTKAFFADPGAIWSPWRMRLLVEHLPEPLPRAVAALWTTFHSKTLVDTTKARTVPFPELGDLSNAEDVPELLHPAR